MRLRSRSRRSQRQATGLLAMGSGMLPSLFYLVVTLGHTGPARAAAVALVCLVLVAASVTLLVRPVQAADRPRSTRPRRISKMTDRAR